MSFCQFWESETVQAFPEGEGEATVALSRVIVLSCTWS
jgi:hypothetical protein